MELFGCEPNVAGTCAVVASALSFRFSCHNTLADNRLLRFATLLVLACHGSQHIAPTELRQEAIVFRSQCCIWTCLFLKGVAGGKSVRTLFCET
jgi:hypothetical protein